MGNFHEGTNGSLGCGIRLDNIQRETGIDWKLFKTRVRGDERARVEEGGTLFFNLFMRACTTIFCCGVVDAPE